MKGQKTLQTRQLGLTFKATTKRTDYGVIETPEEAAAIGKKMAKEAARKLKLRLNK